MSYRTLRLGICIFVVSIAIASQITNLVAAFMVASGVEFWVVVAHSPYQLVLVSFVVATVLLGAIALYRHITNDPEALVTED